MTKELNNMIENKSGKILYFVEQKRNLHCTAIFTMNDKIDPNILNESLKSVLTIYKFVSKDLLLKDNILYFVNNDRPVSVINDKDGVLFGSERISRHQFYVSYYENQIRISISHAITDGGGLFDFSKALILDYLERLTGKHLEATLVRRVEEGTYQDDDVDFYNLDYSKVEPSEANGYEKECFTLPETKEQGEFTLANLYINESKFMEIVKKYETSVPAFLFYLFAKAAYRLNKEYEEENVLARITADVRKILGIPHSQLNCSLAAHLSLKYDDLKEENLPNTLKALKTTIRNQLQPDVVKYEASVLAKTGMYKPGLHPTISISYMGRVDFGEMSPYINDFSIIEGEYHKINFFSLNGQFKIAFHIGKGSKKYADEISKLLKEYNIDSSVSEQIILQKEKQ